jgi:GTP-binding protein
MRKSFREIDERLTPPCQMSLDEAIEYLANDELLEVTPQSYRIRKRILNTEERGKHTKRIKKAQLRNSCICRVDSEHHRIKWLG